MPDPEGRAVYEPILTLPYSEWIVAEHLMGLLRSSDGYAVYALLSRQEKGVDLLVSRRANGVTQAATIQDKYSRAYPSLRGRVIEIAAALAGGALDRRG